jgi:hypothetical protein
VANYLGILDDITEEINKEVIQNVIDVSEKMSYCPNSNTPIKITIKPQTFTEIGGDWELSAIKFPWCKTLFLSKWSDRSSLLTPVTNVLLSERAFLRSCSSVASNKIFPATIINSSFRDCVMIYDSL